MAGARTCVVGSDVDVVGEDAGEHGTVEEGCDDHEGHDGHLLAAGQADADQADSRNQGGCRMKQ